MRLAIVGTVFFAGVATLVWFAVAEGSVPHYRIHDLVSGAYPGGECRIDDGKVVEVQSWGSPLKFTITAREGSAETIQVVSPRHPPDGLKTPHIPVSIRGEYDRESRVFVAEEVTTACPTKYKGVDEEKAGDAAEPQPAAEPAPPSPPAQETPPS